MDLHLQGKFVVVTGGASGIGAAVVRLLSAEGAYPIIVDRDVARGTQLSQELLRTRLVSGDLSTIESCKKIAEDIAQIASSGLYGIVNNAGRNDSIGLENGSPEEYVTSLKQNLHHYYHLTHYLLPLLKLEKGAIVNVSSKTAITGQGGSSAYVSAKGAQLAMTRDWALELAKYSIRVNAVVPAEVMTPMYENWLSHQSDPVAKRKRIEDTIPLEQRMTTPAEMADMIVFLLSDRASHVTGQHIHVDGGYVHLDRAYRSL